jgi:hypothetical protein
LNTDDTKKVARAAAIANLKADLEKLKVILPVNQTFSDCMKKRKGTFKDLLEACSQERKLQGEDPQKIIEKHRATLPLYFTEQELLLVNEGLKSIQFFAYEMWNNQMALEAWKANGCESNVTVLNAEEARKFTAVHKLKPGCAITVEKYESFFERSSKNDNLITSTGNAEISADNLNFLVVPGHVEQGRKTTIEYFHYRKNNEMYRNMLSDINTMTTVLKRLLGSE